MQIAQPFNEIGKARERSTGFHIVERAIKYKRNPCSQWTFCQEDNMMKLGRISTRAHGGAVGRGALRRWVMQAFDAS